MKYQFNACGHPNILATHETTLEFTKDKEVSSRGDCIVGVNAGYDLGKIKQFIKKIRNKKISITIKTIPKSTKLQETVFAQINPYFNSDKELVIRKSDFISERTFAIKSNKAAFELNRNLIGFLKQRKNKINVIINSHKQNNQIPNKTPSA